MSINIAISGFGRIGRLVLRAIYESKRTDIKVVAINCSRGDIQSHAHLIKYDTAHGRFDGKVEVSDDHYIVNDDKIKYFNTRISEELNRKEHKVDIMYAG